MNLIEENQELKKHLEVPETCNLKTLEDYKSYYEDTTREQILEDTYIEYCAYVNLAHRYSKLAKQQKEFIKYLEDVIKELQKIKETELDYDILKDVIPQLLAYEEILQKRKEIIGVSDEKEN